MTYKLPPISTQLDALDDSSEAEFDVIVVGSGYGGSIAAARLSRAGRRVLLLERGREILPGSYPRTVTEARAETQVTTAKNGPLNKNNNGMFDIRINKDVHVVLGCGLGGGSLINANVSVETDPRVMRPPYWPKVYQQPDALKPYYDMARQMLGATPLPDVYNPHKLRALKAAADQMGHELVRPPLNVTFKAGKNAAGVHQDACTMCGDCCSGCNYGAKNTTLMNYLPDAVAHGARIVTEASVTRLSQNSDGDWQVHITDISDDKGRTRTLAAETVILAAGTLGSTEILLRSTQQDTPIPVVKANVGKRFSGNGDALGFGFDANYTLETKDNDKVQPVFGIGAGSRDPDKPQYWPGPCITGMIKVNMGPEHQVDDALVIEEGVAPGALSMIYPAAFFFDDTLSADFTRFPDTARRLNALADLGNGLTNSEAAYSGPVSRTQTYLIMSHDKSGGQITLEPEHDSVTISWKDVGTRKPYTKANDMMRECADTIWANYLQNPLSTEKFGSAIITVHPVGGCVMSDRAADGVVNADCQVFTGDGDAVHDGLLICDGAVIPTSLGLNPLLTISAITERAMDRLITARGWRARDRTSMPEMVQPPVAEIPDPTPVSDKINAYLSQAIDVLDGYVEDIANGESDAVETQLRRAIHGLIDGSEMSRIKKYLAKCQISSSFRQADWIGDMSRSFVSLSGYVKRIHDRFNAKGDGSFDFIGALGVIKEIAGDISPGVSFSEEMTGHLARPSGRETETISDPFEVSARLGASLKQDVTGHFTITVDSIEALQADVLDDDSQFSDHITGLTGTLSIQMPDSPAKRPTRFTLRNASFNMLKQDVAEVDTWKMIYCGAMYATGQQPLFFKGTKTLKRRAGSNWWTDLTRLSVDIYLLDKNAKKPQPTGAPLLRGQMTLGLQDLLVQANTLKSKYENGEVESVFFATTDAISDHGFHKKVAQTAVGTADDSAYMHNVVRAALELADQMDDKEELATAITVLKAKFLGDAGQFFAMLLFRAYGGVPAYLSNFPAQVITSHVLPEPSGTQMGNAKKATSVQHPVFADDGAELQLIRFDGGDKGPVILAPGFATKSLSYAMRTTQQPTLVDRLIDAGYDVWLFDYRSSPALGETSEHAFTLDDIAMRDWPAAINYVTDLTGSPTVKVLAHCVGAMTAQMAVLSESTDKISQMIASQLTVHPVTNWFNMMKADTHIASAIRHGLPANLRSMLPSLIGDPEIERLFSQLDTIDANSVYQSHKNGYRSDQFINMMTWKVPFPYAEPCYSPTCHRIFGIYGPVYAHENLNQATHNALKEVFGKVSTAPFEQLALIMRHGHAVSSGGEDIYLPNVERLNFPIHLVSGALNQEFLPDTTLKTLHWLQKAMPDKQAQFTRHVFPGYAHMDCFIGKNANRDIFDHLLDVLDTPPSP